MTCSKACSRLKITGVQARTVVPNLSSLYSLADCAMQDYRLSKEANAYPGVCLGFGRRYECARLINALVGMREPSLS
jgi:hypothetical protein